MFKKPDVFVTIMSYDRLVELQRWPGIGFGFSVIGGSDTHIPPMICALVRDGPALLSRKVFVGDVLHKVNGVSVTNLETKQVVDLIRNCQDLIVLSLREDRLAKLKARPFLAEDNLIEPPRATKSPVYGQSYGHTQKSPGPYKSPALHKVSSPHKSPAPHKSPYKSPTQHHLEYRSEAHFPDSYSSTVVKKPLTATFSYTESLPASNISKQAYVRNVVGGPKHYEYGTDGRFARRPSIESLEKLNVNKFSMSKGINNHSSENQRHADHSKIMMSPDLKRVSMTTAHVYNVEDLPPSPRSFITVNDNTRPTYRSMANTNKYGSSDYAYTAYEPSAVRKDNPTGIAAQPQYTNNHNKSLLNRIVLQEAQASSAPHYNKQSFDFNESECVTYMREQSAESPGKGRPYSNPELDNSFTERVVYLNEPPTFNDLQAQARNQNYKKQNSNFSSPNVFEPSENMFSEHKGLTLTPNAHSVHSLLSRNFHEENDMTFIDRNHHISPLSLNTPNSSIEPSSVNSPAISSSPASTVSDNISPADIASRLFTLNGYKDTDVAPLLGKNSDFSRQVCREYLRFFSFEGLSLDEAIRVFLDKFPFTGETQERERILIQFSKRYQECNKDPNMSEDAVHTLVCAIMLLNTDLHGQSITNKMSLNDFITNLSGLCDGKDFSKEYLKTLYNAIKNKEIIFSRARVENSPKAKRKNSAPGNPFIELKTNSNDAVLCEGLVYRKSVMDPGGRRTPAMRRNWRPYYCVLKGLVLLSYKPDSINTHEPQPIGVHHSLAGYAKDYKKRAYVFKLITADWSVYYIQANSQDEVRKWMDAFNVSSAMLSSPPLPAPVGSSVRFQRPVMPVSRTKLSLEEQLSHHTEKVQSIEKDLANHAEYPPDTHSKHYQDWEMKLDYLEFELKRFNAYVTVLTAKRLESVRDRLLTTTATKKPSLEKPNGVSDKLRSSSMLSLSTAGQVVVSPGTQRRQNSENREKYYFGSSSP